MGYKLAGFDVIGCNEIDPRMNKVYVANHHPKYNYLCDIRELVKKAKSHDLPEELYQLDILDGSPPCSSFSMCGERENGWGKEKKFREGQVKQVLDTLFFDFIDLARELKPKVIIAENVKGLLSGEAKRYVTKILTELELAGYKVAYTLVNGAYLGIPQKRERVFFTCIREDLVHKVPSDGLFGNPYIDLTFKEPTITWGEVKTNDGGHHLGLVRREYWEQRQYGDLDLSVGCQRLYPTRTSSFNSKFLYNDKVPNTVAAGENCVLFDEPRYRNDTEICLCSSWPLDYNFDNQRVGYICGMSVPPVMMAQVASRVYEQWISQF